MYNLLDAYVVGLCVTLGLSFLQSAFLGECEGLERTEEEGVASKTVGLSQHSNIVAASPRSPNVTPVWLLCVEMGSGLPSLLWRFVFTFRTVNIYQQ